MASLKHTESCSPHSTFILQQADEDRYQLLRNTRLLPLRTITLLQAYSCDLNWMADAKESCFIIMVKTLWQFLCVIFERRILVMLTYTTPFRGSGCVQKKKKLSGWPTGPLQKSEISQLETIHWTWRLVAGRRGGGSELCLVHKVPSSRSVHNPLHDVRSYPTGIEIPLEHSSEQHDQTKSIRFLFEENFRN